MSSVEPIQRILDAPSAQFAASLLPLYSDPLVTIRVGSTTTEYRLSKALVCKQSPYFAATFEGSFKEGGEQSVTLDVIDGVVSTQSFELLIQWFYLGRVIFDLSDPQDEISAIIEFVRLADMCGVTGMETLMAERIKDIIVESYPRTLERGVLDPDSHNYLITRENIISVAFLPESHPVRIKLAMASVEGYMKHDNYKFKGLLQEVPSFSADLLREVRATIKTLKCGSYGVVFTDPFRGKEADLQGG